MRGKRTILSLLFPLLLLLLTYDSMPEDITHPLPKPAVMLPEFPGYFSIYVPQKDVKGSNIFSIYYFILLIQFLDYQTKQLSSSQWESFECFFFFDVAT